MYLFYFDHTILAPPPSTYADLKDAKNFDSIFSQSKKCKEFKHIKERRGEFLRLR
jgi:hypothetical protein